MVCLYTMSADEDFIVDRHPLWPHVVFGAGFSGHGFKFATAIGEHLADLAFDSSVQPYSILSLGRFAENPPFGASPQTRT
jgi:glycine/D-amino acid oxidase-like deaminating enzyme